MEGFITSINNLLWSNPVIYFILAVGLFFSFITRFLQIRHIKDMWQLMFKGKSSEAGVSPFQALTIALSGRIGTGNIAGTATAIAMGGPGAVFWMWLMAFLGAATAFFESTLAQIYKEKKDGVYRGGPAFYIEKGIGVKWFAIIFAIAALLALAILMPGIQSNSIAMSMKNAFGIDPTVMGIIVIGILALVIFGGVKRIASVASYVVPFMAIGYIAVALIIVLLNATEIPGVIALIFRSAFAADSVFGGLIGSAIAWGVKRGVYSNEAGQGTGAHAAAAAEVSHPVKQGLVQSFSVYIDTLFVCSATAFMILFTSSYNVVGADGESFIVENIPGIEAGAEYTQAAVETALPGFGAAFVAISLFFFCFTTIMAYYYMSETNVTYLFSEKYRKPAMLVLKLVILASTFYGAIRTADLAWAFGDVGLGLMVWINLVAILILIKPAMIALKDYEAQKKQGLDPVFNSTKLGIKNADYWANGYQHQEEKDKVS